MAVAGPSTPKSKGSSKKEVSKEVIESDAESGSQSGSESADSDDIDEPSAPTPSRKPTSARTNGSAAVLPAYQPPPGTEPVQVSVSFKSSPFEFDNMANSGMELWAVRIPNDVKPSRLASLQLDASGSGTLSTSSGSFAFIEADENTGAEMDSLTLMVPRMAGGGKLLRAPTKVSRKMMLKPLETQGGEGYTVAARKSREQPEHLLKFRNRAFGFDTKGPERKRGESNGEVDADEDRSAEKAERKKRKLESPKKSKSSKDKSRKDKA